jgi:hypothetical protein
MYWCVNDCVDVLMTVLMQIDVLMCRRLMCCSHEELNFAFSCQGQREKNFKREFTWFWKTIDTVNPTKTEIKQDAKSPKIVKRWKFPNWEKYKKLKFSSRRKNECWMKHWHMILQRTLWRKERKKAKMWEKIPRSGCPPPPTLETDITYWPVCSVCVGEWERGVVWGVFDLRWVGHSTTCHP